MKYIVIGLLYLMILTFVICSIVKFLDGDIALGIMLMAGALLFSIQGMFIEEVYL